MTFPNARFALNFKNIPYQTTWVEYPDIQALYTTLGAKPTSTKADGITPYYTLPLIVDQSELGKDPVIISDSWDIAVYLDEAYPSTPRLFPKGTKAFQAAFQELWTDTFIGFAAPLLLPRTPQVALYPASREFFYRTRQEQFGKPLPEIEPQGEARAKHLKEWEVKLGKIAKVYEQADSEGRYIMGNEVVYADFVAAAWVKWMKLVARKEDWKVVDKWHGGLVERIGERVEEYVKLP